MKPGISAAGWHSLVQSTKAMPRGADWSVIG